MLDSNIGKHFIERILTSGSTSVAGVLNMSLGDLLLAGIVKDPEDAGRMIVAAITQVQASIAAEDTPEANAESAHEVMTNPKHATGRAVRDIAHPTSTVMFSGCM